MDPTAIITTVEEGLQIVIEGGILLMEFFGLTILLVTGIRSFIRWLKHDAGMKLYLARGIALSLEFKMGGEILRTVVVREWKELGILAVVIAMRVVMSVLIHWEIRNEEKAASAGPETAADYEEV